MIKPGEFILGYENESNVFSAPPALSSVRDWGRNGSPLIMRQLRQHVNGFDRFIEQHSNGDAYQSELLAARLVGRGPSGAPLVLTPENDNPQMQDESNFDYYRSDRYGYRCPLGAHIRRSNPRDALVDEKLGETVQDALDKVRRHRIIRRGRVYHKGDNDQGLLFLCLTASIEDQSEFVEHNWMTTSNFAQLEGENDPLIGTGAKISLQDPYTPTCLDGLGNFVQVKGGAYFFLPAIRALRSLADPAGPTMAAYPAARQ